MQSKGFFCKYTSAYFWFDVLSLIKNGFFQPCYSLLKWTAYGGDCLRTPAYISGNAWKNDGQRREKRRATLEKTTGNKIYNDGQQNFKQWATKFRATGNGILSNEQRDFIWGTTDIVNSWGNGHRNIYTNLICISKSRAYLIYSLFMRIYIYALE